MIEKCIRLLRDPKYRFAVLSDYGFLNHMSDEKFLKKKFRLLMGYPLDLENPRTFNEKLQWLKLHDRNPLYTTMADKYAVKEYVAQKIGAEYVIPNLGVWERAEDVDFSKLPDRFVLKCTHDSHGLVICKDRSKLDEEKAREILREGLKQNYYQKFREWPYKDIKPRIIAEQYMEDDTGEELRDYKVLCFGGEPKLIELHQGRYSDHPTQDYYDVEWKRSEISQGQLRKYHTSGKDFPKPPVLDEMLRCSRILSEGIPHIRVDWYCVSGKLYFGELTFYDGAGFAPFDKKEYDLLLGSWIKLPGKES